MRQTNFNRYFLKCNVYTTQLARSCSRTLGRNIYLSIDFCESFELKIYAYNTNGLCRRFSRFSNNIFKSKSKSIEQKSNSIQRKLFDCQAFDAVSIGQTKMKNERILTSNRISCQLKLLLILQQSGPNHNTSLKNAKFLRSPFWLSQANAFSLHSNGLPFNAIDI